MPAPHETRIQTAVNRFEEATARMVAMLEALSDDAARRAPSEGAWTPAQVGYHVAITNELFAGIFSGAVPMAKQAPAGFNENPDIFSGLSGKRVQTLPPLEPPSSAARADAIAKLRSSERALVSAIKALPPDRAVDQVLEFPFGTINLYQAAEFAGAHVGRHVEQIRRCTSAA
jgi:hypothetical protein